MSLKASAKSVPINKSSVSPDKCKLFVIGFNEDNFLLLLFDVISVFVFYLHHLDRTNSENASFSLNIVIRGFLLACT